MLLRSPPGLRDATLQAQGDAEYDAKEEQPEHNVGSDRNCVAKKVAGKALEERAKREPPDRHAGLDEPSECLADGPRDVAAETGSAICDGDNAQKREGKCDTD
jgi:hypothetical protein